MAPTPRPHRRRDDPEDFETAHERSQDLKPLGKINKWLDDWKILWIVGFPLILAFGFDFKTPGSQFEEIHKNQTQFSNQMVETNRILGVLVFLRCEDIRTRNETNNMAEVQLNCIDIYNKLSKQLTTPPKQ